MGNWTIRRAENRDADALSTCIEAAYAQYAARISNLPPVSADCAEGIEKYQVWVAEVEEQVVGGLVLVPKEGFMLLANVAVHPIHMGTGLGGALLALAETESVEQGYSELRLTTHVDMPEIIQLYAHLGWEHDYRHDNEVSMKKVI